MGKIGNFGKTIVFEVSANKILTPKNFKRTVSGQWKKHGIIGQKPKMEFTGPDSDETTLTVMLSAEHGVKPRKTIEKIETAVRNGTVDYLVIGGKKIGKNKVYISSISESWDDIWNKGELVRATLDITFGEYK